MGLVVFYANWKIPHDADPYIFDNIDDVPEHSIALVLGTTRYIGSRQNLYFNYRIQAAKELYESGKIDAFVLSGDNRFVNYNEPRDMRQALVEVGVPDSIINLDYAGFRTLDSVIRMNKVFGQKSFIVVSQRFHNERAVYIARQNDIEAFGYNAQDLSLNRFSVKTKVRELLARVKVFVDITLGIDPKFLGDEIEISRSIPPTTKELTDSTSVSTDSIQTDSLMVEPQ